MHKINHSLLIGISGNEVKGMLNKYYQPQYLNEDNRMCTTRQALSADGIYRCCR